jgi:hypothetical protein
VVVTRWIARAFALAIVALAPLLPAQVSVAAAPQGNQGLQDGWAIDDDGKFSGGLHLLSDGEFAYMRGAGAGWVRINFRLGKCFDDWTTPVPQSAIDSGRCNASTLNRTAADQYVSVVQNARAQGLRVLGLLSNESWHADPSAWVANNSEHNATANGDNPYVHAFASAAGVLAARLKGSQLVEEWEVWNEPNAWTSNPSTGVYTGGTFIYPSNFAQLLKQSRDSIKAANSSAIVISGGLFGHDAAAGTLVISVQPDGSQQRFVKHGGFAAPTPAAAAGPTPILPDALPGRAAAVSCTTSIPSGADYLCQTYVVGRSRAGWGRSGPFDHIGEHLYVDQGGVTSAANISQFLSDVRRIYVGFEGTSTAKRTELTELGWNTLAGGITPAIQAQNLTTAYQDFHSTAYVRRAFWFRTQDLPWDGYGLIGFESNGTATPKPAYTAYQQSAVY